MPKKLIKSIAVFLVICLFCEQSSFAQVLPQISPVYFSQPSFLVPDKFRPLHLRSLEFSPQTASLQVLLDKGDIKELDQAVLKETTKKLMDYFLIGLSLPNDSFWVNLRPDQPDNIIDQYLQKTDMGKVMLEADLNLKKDLAQATSPRTKEGKEYWDKLYAKAQELFGGQQVTLPTFTRPWIVPGEIIIRQSKSNSSGLPVNAYIYKATLKVMLEQDYLKEQTPKIEDRRLKELNDYSSGLIRRLIIPKLTLKVNSSKAYASLRQVYYSLILSQWLKNEAKNGSRFSVLGSGKGTKEDLSATLKPYIDRIDTKDLNNLTSQQSWSKDVYFKQYKQSFQKGEYNECQTINTAYGQTIRQYTSGGIVLQPVKGMITLDGGINLPMGQNLVSFSFAVGVSQSQVASELEYRQAVYNYFSSLKTLEVKQKEGLLALNSPEGRKVIIGAYSKLMEGLIPVLELDGEQVTFLYPFQGPDVIPAIFRKTYPLNKEVNDFGLGEWVVRDILGEKKDVNIMNRQQALDAQDRNNYKAVRDSINGPCVFILKGFENWSRYKKDLTFSRELLKYIVEDVLRKGDKLLILDQKELELFQSISPECEMSMLGGEGLAFKAQDNKVLNVSIKELTSNEWKSFRIPNLVAVIEKKDGGQKDQEIIIGKHAQKTGSDNAAGGQIINKVKSLFGLEYALDFDLVKVMEGDGFTIRRVKLPVNIVDKRIQARVDLLKNELVRMANFNLNTVDLLYQEGRLLAIFPVFPDDVARKFIEFPSREVRYLNLAPYYFTIPEFGAPGAHESWESFAKRLEADMRVVYKYKNRKSSAVKYEVNHEQSPYFYAQVNKNSGEIVTEQLFAIDEERYIFRSPWVTLDKLPGKEQIIIPVLPTVYSMAHHWPSDKEYYKYLAGSADIKDTDTVLVVGPGTGMELWLANLFSRQKKYAIGKNPIEKENAELTARAGGFSEKIEVITADNIISFEGEPRFKDIKFDKVLWNMPNYNPYTKDRIWRQTASLPMRGDMLWDNDFEGQALRRFSQGLPVVLSSPVGRAILWNVLHLERPNDEQSDIVKKIIETGGSYKSSEKQNKKIFDVSRVGSETKAYGSFYIVSWPESNYRPALADPAQLISGPHDEMAELLAQATGLSPGSRTDSLGNRAIRDGGSKWEELKAKGLWRSYTVKASPEKDDTGSQLLDWVFPKAVESLPNGAFVVGDSGALHGAAIYNPDGSVIFLCDENGSYLKEEIVRDLAVDEPGNIFAVTSEGIIRAYSMEGELLGSYKINNDYLPRDSSGIIGDLVAFQGKLYFSVQESGELRELDLSTGEERTFWGQGGQERTFWNQGMTSSSGLMNLTINKKAGVIYITGGRFGQGSSIRTFDIATQKSGEIKYMPGLFLEAAVAVDSNEVVYMIDDDKRIIWVLPPKGELGYLPTYISKTMSSIAVDKDNNLLIGRQGGFEVISQEAVKAMLVKASVSLSDGQTVNSKSKGWKSSWQMGGQDGGQKDQEIIIGKHAQKTGSDNARRGWRENLRDRIAYRQFKAMSVGIGLISAVMMKIGRITKSDRLKGDNNVKHTVITNSQSIRSKEVKADLESLKAQIKGKVLTLSNDTGNSLWMYNIEGFNSFIAKIIAPEGILGKPDFENDIFPGVERAERLGKLAADTAVVRDVEVVIAGERITVDLLLQRKLIPLDKEIRELAEQGRMQEVKLLLEEFKAINIEIWKKGLIIPDILLFNFGYNEASGQIQLIEFSDLVEEYDQLLAEDFAIAYLENIDLLKNISPEITGYYRSTELSIKDFNRIWGHQGLNTVRSKDGGQAFPQSFGRIYANAEEIRAKYAGKKVLVLDVGDSLGDSPEWSFSGKGNYSLYSYVEESLLELNKEGIVLGIWSAAKKEDISDKFLKVYPQIAGLLDFAITIEDYDAPNVQEKEKFGLDNSFYNGRLGKPVDVLFPNAVLVDDGYAEISVGRRRGIPVINSREIKGVDDFLAKVRAAFKETADSKGLVFIQGDKEVDYADGGKKSGAKGKRQKSSAEEEKDRLWRSQQVHDYYDESRRYFVPLNEAIVQGVAAEYLQDPEFILELGSGRGTFARMLQESIRKKLVQSDQYKDLLESNSADTAKMAVNAYHIPFSEGKVPAIASYAVLDTFFDLKSAVGEMSRVLVPGGKMVGFIDLAPSHEALMHAFPKDILFPASVDFQGIPRGGFLRVDRQEFKKRFQTYKSGKQINRQFLVLLEQYSNDPVEFYKFVQGSYSLQEYMEICKMFEDVLKVMGVDYEVLNDIEVFRGSLEKELRQAGFKILVSRFATAGTKEIDKRLLPGFPGDTNALIFHTGSQYLKKDASISPGKAIITSTIYVVVAEKPGLEAEGSDNIAGKEQGQNTVSDERKIEAKGTATGPLIDKINDLFALQEVELFHTISEDQAGDMTIRRVKVPQKIPARWEIIHNRMMGTKNLRIEMLDLLYRQGRLIAVFPAYEDKVAQLYRNEILALGRYFITATYYFSVPPFEQKGSLEAWKQFAYQLKKDMEGIKAYKAYHLPPETRGINDPAYAYSYVEVDKNSGAINAKKLFSYDGELELNFDSIFQGDSSGKYRQIIPVLPTVSPIATNWSHDRSYYNYIFRHSGFKKGDTILVVGPGAGFDTWLMALLTGAKVYAVGINPREIENLKMTAALIGFSDMLVAKVEDNIISGQGEPRFPGIVFDGIVWNMPNYISDPDDGRPYKSDDLAFQWDGDYRGSILRRFASGLKLLLKNPAGKAIIWNTPDYKNNADGSQYDIVEKIVESAGEFISPQQGVSKVFDVNALGVTPGENISSSVYVITCPQNKSTVTVATGPNEDIEHQKEQNKAWGSLRTFQMFERGRKDFRPAIQVTVQKIARAYLQDAERILELGSGLGELGRLLPPEILAKLTQTDRSMFLLNKNSVKSAKAGVDIYRMPFRNGEIPAIASYAALDTLFDLKSGVREISRVLAPGGVLVNFLDLAPTQDVFMAAFPNDVLFPAYANFQNMQRMTFLRVNRKELLQRLVSQNKLSSKQTALMFEYIADPAEALSAYTSRLPVEKIVSLFEEFKNILKIMQVSYEEVNDIEFFKSSLEKELRDAGLEIIISDYLTDSLVKRKEEVPIQWYPGANAYAFHTGSGVEGVDDSLAPGQVRLMSTIYVVVAKKPGSTARDSNNRQGQEISSQQTRVQLLAEELNPVLEQAAQLDLNAAIGFFVQHLPQRFLDNLSAQQHKEIFNRFVAFRGDYAGQGITPELKREIIGRHARDIADYIVSVEENNSKADGGAANGKSSVTANTQGKYAMPAQDMDSAVWDEAQKSRDSFDDVGKKVRRSMPFIDVGPTALPGEEIELENMYLSEKTLRIVKSYSYPGADPKDALRVKSNFARAINSVVKHPRVYYIGLGYNEEVGHRFNLLIPLLETNFGILIGVEKEKVSFEQFKRLITNELEGLLDPGTSIEFTEPEESDPYAYTATFSHRNIRRTVKAYFNLEVPRDYPAELEQKYNVLLYDISFYDQQGYNELISRLDKEAGFIIGQGKDSTTDSLSHRDLSDCIFLGRKLPEKISSDFSEINSRQFFNLGKRAYWGSGSYPKPRPVLLAHNKTVDNITNAFFVPQDYGEMVANSDQRPTPIGNGSVSMEAGGDYQTPGGINIKITKDELRGLDISASQVQDAIASGSGFPGGKSFAFDNFNSPRWNQMEWIKDDIKNLILDKAKHGEKTLIFYEIGLGNELREPEQIIGALDEVLSELKSTGNLDLSGWRIELVGIDTRDLSGKYRDKARELNSVLKEHNIIFRFEQGSTFDLSRLEEISQGIKGDYIFDRHADYFNYNAREEKLSLKAMGESLNDILGNYISARNLLHVMGKKDALFVVEPIAGMNDVDDNNNPIFLIPGATPLDANHLSNLNLPRNSHANKGTGMLKVQDPEGLSRAGIKEWLELMDNSRASKDGGSNQLIIRAYTYPAGDVRVRITNPNVNNYLQASAGTISVGMSMGYRSLLPDETNYPRIIIAPRESWVGKDGTNIMQLYFTTVINKAFHKRNTVIVCRPEQRERIRQYLKLGNPYDLPNIAGYPQELISRLRREAIYLDDRSVDAQGNPQRATHYPDMVDFVEFSAAGEANIDGITITDKADGTFLVSDPKQNRKTLLQGKDLQELKLEIEGVNKLSEIPELGVTFLGTSSAMDPNGLPSNQIIWAGKQHILIDVNTPTLAALSALGLTPRDVTHVAITHMHEDHVAGLLSYMEWCKRDGHPIRLVAEPGIYQLFKEQAQQILNKEIDQQYSIEFLPLAFYSGITLGDGEGSVSIESAPAFHGTPTMMLRFTYKGQTISHSSDTTFDPVRFEQILENRIPENIRAELVELAGAAADTRVFDEARAEEISGFLLRPNQNGRSPGTIIFEGGNAAVYDRNGSNHTTPWALQRLPEKMQQNIFVNHTAKLPDDGNFMFQIAAPFSTVKIESDGSIKFVSKDGGIGEIGRNDADERSPSIPGKEVSGIDSSTAKSSPSILDNKLGGIDFRGLPINAQAVPAALPNLPVVSRSLIPLAELDNEWKQIQEMVSRGDIPSSAKIKEYVLSCCRKGDIAKDIQRVLVCISEIMRLEEDYAVACEPGFVQLLAMLESGKLLQ